MTPSSDDSVALAQERYGHCIDRFEINQTNSGNPFVQWNRGVRMAKGGFRLDCGGPTMFVPQTS